VIKSKFQDVTWRTPTTLAARFSQFSPNCAEDAASAHAWTIGSALPILFREAPAAKLPANR
jgi:hypothetical protein